MGIKLLYGLVVCGGQSSRMGTDKSMLVYYGMPQMYYLYDMLEKLCNKTFLSCNVAQSEEIPNDYNLIIDTPKYTNSGPMAAIFSAFEKYPEANFLVVGCDYPFIKSEHLAYLIDSFSGDALAASYYNEKEKVREPLLAIYRSECYAEILMLFEKGDYSLNHFLKDIDAQKIIPSSPEIIISIDTKEEYEETLKILEQRH